MASSGSRGLSDSVLAIVKRHDGESDDVPIHFRGQRHLQRRLFHRPLQHQFEIARTPPATGCRINLNHSLEVVFVHKAHHGAVRFQGFRFFWRLGNHEEAPLSNAAERLSSVHAKDLSCDLLRPRAAKKCNRGSHVCRLNIFPHQIFSQGSVADRLRQAVGEWRAHPYRLH